ncbi:MAG TPA: TM0106 family RecB-like putative nuclease [Pirellulales bacterium]|nr:TM0106 family RecB-like putative nuclease [Pirellulales bacterium]HVB82223.1 TM0106 family RecB-like putative nuclease [Candidatus Binataceae bacterium]
MISNEVFVSFITCRRKAFIKQTGQVGEEADIERVQLQLDKKYLGSGLDRFLAQQAVSEILRDPPSLEIAIQSRVRFVVGATALVGNLCSRLDLLERLDDGEKNAAMYAPVLFVRSNKVTKSDRLLLAFQALTFSHVHGAVPVVGKIIFGGEFRLVRVRLASLVDDVRRMVALIEADSAKASAPSLTLIRHCAACEFRKDCQAVAEQTDDLSLLRSLSEKEIQKQRSRGVTTLTQFSHAYQPGRRGKRQSEKARKHDAALQTLALREKKVYVMDAPSLVQPKVAIYLDVEGVPDRDFYYLIGLLVVEQGRSTFHSFWADNASQENVAWDRCLQVVESFSEYTLYHYGQYETRFLERMKERGREEVGTAIDHVLTRSCNVLSVIYSHIYFPTRSNGLKDVATLLGFRWSVEEASGLQALAWRLAWELEEKEALKQKLVRYNQEDCLALRAYPRTPAVRSVTIAN